LRFFIPSAPHRKVSPPFRQKKRAGINRPTWSSYLLLSFMLRLPSHQDLRRSTSPLSVCRACQNVSLLHSQAILLLYADKAQSQQLHCHSRAGGNPVFQSRPYPFCRAPPLFPPTGRPPLAAHHHISIISGNLGDSQFQEPLPQVILPLRRLAWPDKVPYPPFSSTAPGFLVDFSSGSRYRRLIPLRRKDHVPCDRQKCAQAWSA
jgi:hypothetical protein